MDTNLSIEEAILVQDITINHCPNCERLQAELDQANAAITHYTKAMAEKRYQQIVNETIAKGFSDGKHNQDNPQ